MQIAKVGALCLLIATGVTSCAWSPLGRKEDSRTAAGKSPAGGIAEFRVTSYDERELKGRVLVGATVDPLVLDGRLAQGVKVELNNMKACGRQEPLKHHFFEVLLPPPQPSDLVTILPGYWYGVNVAFALFDEERTLLGPECFEADLVVRDINMRVAATLPIVVHRTGDGPPAVDGGR
jgi:hypothetical protein